MAMIRYEGFTKHYGRLIAVSGLDLTVEPGKTLALVGPNGSGKSTTLKAALGLVRPTRGRVTVEGLDVNQRGRETRGRLGYLPQGLSFPDGCTAREVMCFVARLRRLDEREIPSLLERVDLLPAADREASGFSGGMKQRLGLALALLGRPRALVLDEPTAALDPTGSLAVRDLIKEIGREGTTVVISSHDLGEVAALADQVAMFVAGRLAVRGSVEELGRSIASPHLQARERMLEEVYRVVASRAPPLVA